jgi:hypothetical protein
MNPRKTLFFLTGNLYKRDGIDRLLSIQYKYWCLALTQVHYLCVQRRHVCFARGPANAKCKPRVSSYIWRRADKIAVATGLNFSSIDPTLPLRL